MIQVVTNLAIEFRTRQRMPIGNKNLAFQQIATLPLRSLPSDAWSTEISGTTSRMPRVPMRCTLSFKNEATLRDGLRTRARVGETGEIRKRCEDDPRRSDGKSFWAASVTR